MEDICKQWEINKNSKPIINPRTGREIKKDGPKYIELEEECQKWKANISPLSSLSSNAGRDAQLLPSESTPPPPPSLASSRPPSAASPTFSSLPYPPLPFPQLPSKDPVTLLLQMVLSKKIELDPCTLVDRKSAIQSVTNFLIPHSSASPTENIQVTLNFTDGTKATIFLKIWPNMFDLDKTAYKYAALDFEVSTYEYITTQILIPMQSPNFIPFLGFGTCPLQTTKFDIRDEFSFQKLLKNKMLSDPNAHLKVLLTGSSANIKPLYKIAHTIVKRSEVVSILFQIVHALYCLQMHGITHLDFHTGNVLIETLATPMVLQYTTNGVFVVKFKTSYLVKIYDFDRSIRKTQQNEIYKDLFYRETASYPSPDRMNQDRDLYQIICGLLQYHNFKSDVEEILLYPAFKDVELDEIMDHDEGRKFSLHVSKETGEKIEKESPVDSDTNAYDIPIDKLKAIMTPPEFISLQNYKDFPIMKTCLFTLKSMKSGYIMIFNKGWRCQLVHQIKDGVFYHLKDIFRDFFLFSQFALRLDTVGEDPDAVFEI
jgi:serine/threonine protein kinase